MILGHIFSKTSFRVAPFTGCLWVSSNSFWLCLLYLCAFLMGIVPNNHQINYHNEEFIIVCVGSGGAGADGV